MKRLFFPILMVLIFKGLIAQVTGEKTNNPQNEFAVFFSNLSVNQDSRLNQMVENHIGKNLSTNGMPGFRVEIFARSGSKAREEAMKVKSDILSSFPDINVHVKFISPDFKVRAGDFRTKNEALKFKKQVEGRYRSFIVPDIIDLPKLEPLDQN
jgi:hypothetical protein